MAQDIIQHDQDPVSRSGVEVVKEHSDYLRGTVKATLDSVCSAPLDSAPLGGGVCAKLAAGRFARSSIVAVRPRLSSWRGVTTAQTADTP